MCKFKAGFLLAFILCLLMASMSKSAWAEDPLAEEDERKKAQVIYSLALFVTWPPAHFNSAETAVPFKLCLLGHISSGLHDSLQSITKTKNIQGHRIELLTIQPSESQPQCHLAFIGEALSEPLATLLPRLHQSAILTLSDQPNFAEAGGMIALLQTGQRVRFGINLAAAEQAGLSIRAQLLVMSGTSLLGKKNPHTQTPTAKDDAD